MHRLLVIQTRPDHPNKFCVIADSADPAVSEADPASIERAGGSDWSEFDDSTGYSSPYAIAVDGPKALQPSR